MAIPAELAEQAHRISPATMANDQVLAVPELFHGLLPSGGFQRGWTVRVEGSASARALAWALLGNATTSGRWVATVNVEGICLAAASELGVAIERVLVVSNVGAKAWSSTLGALIGAVDVIVFDAPEHRIPPSEYRKIASRCRERGTVLVELGTRSPRRPGRLGNTGQLQYDVSFSVQPTAWTGLEGGYGYLQTRCVEVSVSGRRAVGQQRQGTFGLPTADGTLQRIDAPPQSQQARLTAVQ